MNKPDCHKFHEEKIASATVNVQIREMKNECDFRNADAANSSRGEKQ